MTYTSSVHIQNPKNNVEVKTATAVMDKSQKTVEKLIDAVVRYKKHLLQDAKNLAKSIPDLEPAFPLTLTNGFEHTKKEKCFIQIEQLNKKKEVIDALFSVLHNKNETNEEKLLSFKNQLNFFDRTSSLNTSTLLCKSRNLSSFLAYCYRLVTSATPHIYILGKGFGFWSVRGEKFIYEAEHILKDFNTQL